MKRKSLAIHQTHAQIHHTVQATLLEAQATSLQVQVTIQLPLCFLEGEKDEEKEFGYLPSSCSNSPTSPSYSFRRQDYSPSSPSNSSTSTFYFLEREEDGENKFGIHQPHAQIQKAVQAFLPLFPVFSTFCTQMKTNDLNK